MPRLNLCDEKSEFPEQSEVGARRIGDDELKRWPALLQCLLGLQCQSRPSAAQIRENGLQSRIWRVRAHPLTVGGPKPAFKWSKHRRPPNAGSRASRTTKPGPARRHSPDATLPHTLICAQSSRAVCPVLDAARCDFGLCCADDTHFES